MENGKLKIENGKWKGYCNIFCHPEQAERSEGSIYLKVENGKWKVET
jgi:hypothetical protein